MKKKVEKKKITSEEEAYYKKNTKSGTIINTPNTEWKTQRATNFPFCWLALA